MKSYPLLITLCFISFFAHTTNAFQPAQSTQWDRTEAIAAAKSVNIDQAVDAINSIVLNAGNEAALLKLKQLEIRSDWPLPAREAAIYQLTQSLADLPRNAVSSELLHHLQNYQSLTLVPHEDHGNAYIPLFNIRGAATGVENGWQRDEYTVEAYHLLSTDMTAFVDGFARSGNNNQRSAYLDTARHAELEVVVELQYLILQQLDETSGLTPLLGVTTVAHSNLFAIRQLLVHGQGAGLSFVLEQLNQQLSPSDTAVLLEFAVKQAPPGNATLAMAAWWPRLKYNSAMRELMIETLADPALGSSAAMALAQNSDVETIKILQDTAKGDSNAARRAQIALDVNRARVIVGDRP